MLALCVIALFAVLQAQERMETRFLAPKTAIGLSSFHALNARHRSSQKAHEQAKYVLIRLSKTVSCEKPRTETL